MPGNLTAQCNTNTSICTPGVAGPFNFNTPGVPVSTCLDFYGPSVSYITLYITQGGPLELLFDGNATSGYIDVAIFNVPVGIDPCIAIQNNVNEIGCNYASNSSGCNQFGTTFSCASWVPAPIVNAGDELMIVVENWSGVAFTFTMQLGTGAQTGPPNALITATTPMQDSDPPVQMISVDAGGTWSATCGACIDPVTGMFDPNVAGVGNHTVCYDIGVAPCNDQDCELVTVNNPLPVEISYASLNCEFEEVELEWETVSELNCDYFEIEKSRAGLIFEPVAIVDGSGTTIETQHYSYSEVFDFVNYYYQLTQVDFDGKKEVVEFFYADCEQRNVQIYPNPAENKVVITLTEFDLSSTTIEVFDNLGRRVMVIPAGNNGENELSLDGFSSQLYTVKVSDSFAQKIQRFTKL
ncbi:MAG: T9SS type A sorting domain-containing protein [Crocinitomicaceae bacterium]|nr:T9SS type A sorting domain-containing protein [Crocinitomicaceae bacterium]